MTNPLQPGDATPDQPSVTPDLAVDQSIEQTVADAAADTAGRSADVFADAKMVTDIQALIDGGTLSEKSGDS